ncbi:peptide methionine sulfoxide reductase B8 [Trypanosoma rangeli]|uniref:Peptide methionine sulfoxide reductase B8 n=1 Tax=Trypanosoma rangeli TaxID=5698 RepID=A0A422NKJ0_TRYRA|nr:peptide methionine sulfoxide reductase B8 [Trypanosoma rangeli]RNF05983.1 peptide methionine sulfoxide reductase B8 [Trypanosoma rangeli]|eukprot:RNF05983.1 peptide methionine sulfoxide reductase B8 [Trypanosoma rangeli]
MRQGGRVCAVAVPSLLLPLCVFVSRHFFSTSRGSQMTHCASRAEADGSKDVGDTAWRKRLTPVQFHILREKGTDPRYGPYDSYSAPGDYLCAACGTRLYTSEMKFLCSCGWPAFWDCVPGAVREEPDSDGIRTEILCNACNSHLGHVFRGEGFHNPPPNERHCVNNTSLQFQPRQ